MKRWASFFLVISLMCLSASAFADSSIVPIGKSPSRGANKATITIVAFENLQCPFTQRVQKTLTSLLAEKDLRIVSKLHPLAFHKNAELASKATLAAVKFGKFWELHDALFEEQKQWRNMPQMQFESYLIALAGSLKIDEDKFEKELNSKSVKKRLQQDMELARKLGITGTPGFMINGRRLPGAQPLEKFLEIIKEERLAMKGKSKSYAKRVKANYEPKRPQTDTARKPVGKMAVVFVPLRKGAPLLGSKNGVVNWVVFGDFQCPYCSRLMVTVRRIAKEHHKDVRIEWRHLPLPFHKQAMEAAQIAEAAKRQGKFWEMNELLFERQPNFKSENMFVLGQKLARELGLDHEKFTNDYHDSKIADRIRADAALAKELNIRGTPTSVINGVLVSGAQPMQRFVEEIETQKRVSKSVKKKKKKKGAELYREIVKHNDRLAAKKNRAGIDAK